jgi:hypothetical protein
MKCFMRGWLRLLLGTNRFEAFRGLEDHLYTHGEKTDVGSRGRDWSSYKWHLIN